MTDANDARRGTIEPPTEEQPAYRPIERFWPYADLPEDPTDEEVAALDPELRAVLFKIERGPFSLSIVFPRFDGPGYARAVEMARASAEYGETGAGSTFKHRARFLSSDPDRLRDLFHLVGGIEGCEVLVDDRPVPYARELWLPLFWFLIAR